MEGGKLVLRLRGDKFQARVSLGSGKYIWRSLKTDRLDVAKPLALKFLHEIEFRQEHGLSIFKRTFGDVIKEYVALRQKQHDRVGIRQTEQNYTSTAMLRQIKRVSKFWLEYAGNMPVTSINDSVLRNYVDWRRDYYTNVKTLPKNARLHPTDKTLLWESTLGRTLLKFATERGYRANMPMPLYRFKLKHYRVRPAFSNGEIDILLDRIEHWIDEAKNDVWRYTRILLRNYIQVLINSGMRVGEANNLKRRDVTAFRDENQRLNYRFIVRGKTGEREVVLRSHAVKYVDLALEHGTNKEPDAWLFCMGNGQKIKTLIDQFDIVLQSVGIVYDAKGFKFTLYSLRHYYAVDAIRRGIPIYEISRNMGTSLEMLQKYYANHALTATTATRLGN